MWRYGIILSVVLLCATAYQRGGRGINWVGDCDPTGAPDIHGPPASGSTQPCLAPAPPTGNALRKTKLDYDQNVKDAARAALLANEIQHALEAAGPFGLSVPTVKKSEELEKLTKKLHDRLKNDTSRR